MKYLCLTLWVAALFLTTQLHAQRHLLRPVKGGITMPDIAGPHMPGGILFFAADTAHGSELWVSDGTTAGTHIVKDIIPGDSSGTTGLRQLMTYGRLYFTAKDNELWVSNGTDTGTYAINADSFRVSSDFVWYNQKLYFDAYTISTGTWDVWCSDGTSTGTFKFKDACPNYTGQSAKLFTVANGKLFFAASTPAHGEELWVTDGTNTGTYMVKDLYPGTEGSIKSELHVYDKKIYFLGKENNQVAYGLYAADADSITLVKNINYDINVTVNYMSGPALVVNKKLVFYTADTLDNVEPWVTDGTAAGTKMLANIQPGLAGSNPIFLGLSDGGVVFAANDQPGQQLGSIWATDGTDTGTRQISTNTILNDKVGSAILSYYKSTYGVSYYSATVFFISTDSVNGYELWRTSGSNTSNILVDDYIPGSGGMTDFHDMFYYDQDFWVSATYANTSEKLFYGEAPLVTSVENTATKKPDFAKIYPNPNTGSFSIELNKRGFKNGYLKVTDINGRTIYDQSIAQGTQQLPVTLSNTSVGVYMVTVQLDSDVMTQSIVVR